MNTQTNHKSSYPSRRRVRRAYERGFRGLRTVYLNSYCLRAYEKGLRRRKERSGPAAARKWR